MQYIMSNKFLVVLNDKNEALAFEIIKDKNGKTWLPHQGHPLRESMFNPKLEFCTI